MTLRFFAIVALSAMIVSCQTNDQTFSEESDYVHICGRYDDEDSANARFSYPGVKIQIAVNAATVDICLTDSTRPGDNGEKQSNVVGIYIDGAFAKKIELQDGMHTYRVAENLAKGIHKIEVVKLTESLVGFISFHHFKVSDLKKIVHPQIRKRKLEFIGNSITCGYGIEAENELQHFSCKTENVSKAYAFQCAEMLNADAQLVCYSGRGVYRNWADTVFYQETMLEMYSRSLALHPDIDWDFARFTPQAVVINLGTNDFSPPLGAEKALFIPRYNALLDIVRDNYGPYTEIVCLNGPMLIGAHRQTLEEWLQEIVEERKDQNIHYFPLTVCQPEDGWGADYHPSEISAQRNAKELATYLSDLLQWN